MRTIIGLVTMIAGLALLALSATGQHADDMYWSEDFSAFDIAQVCWEAQKVAILQGDKRVGQQELLEATYQQRRRKSVEGRRNG